MNTQPLQRKPSQRFSISLAKTFGVRAAQAAAPASRLQAPHESIVRLEKSLAVGDVLFTQVRLPLLRKVLDEAATRRKYTSRPHELFCTITPSLMRV